MDHQMDYTMEPQLPNTPPQCQPQQSHQLPGPSSFASAARDAHYYDPVHNTDAWFPGNAANPHLQPQYAIPQNIPQWASRHYSPMQNWPPYGEPSTEPHRAERAGPMPQLGYMGMANSYWNQGRSFEANFPQSSTHGSYASNGAIPIPRPALHTSSPTTSPQLGLPIGSQIPSYMAFNAGPHMRANEYPAAPATSSNLMQRMGAIAAQNVLRDPMAPEAGLEQRAHRARGAHPAFGRTTQSREASIMRAYASQEAAHRRRRNPPPVESDDDDDDSLDDPEANAIRRGAETLLGDALDERALAAMRAQVAAAKKTPSKDALASLEEVMVKDLKEDEQCCIICYNELGMVNPEGVMEKPIRLPKCRHIFGDKCIRKWFEDNDTCPYCRDKLPSDVAVRKSFALESLRAYRAQITRTVDRAMMGQAARFRPTDELTGNPAGFRSPDDYRHAMSTYHQPDQSWNYSPPSRTSGVDTPESRRRQARGRVGANRTASHATRPTAVASSRYLAPNFSTQASIQHLPTLGSSAASAHPSLLPPISPAAMMNGNNFSYLHPIPRNRPLANNSQPSADASPAVAVSPVGQATQRNAQTAQRQRSGTNDYADPFTAFSYHTGGANALFGRFPGDRPENGPHVYDTNTGVASSAQSIHDENMVGTPIRNSVASSHSPRSFDSSSSTDVSISRWGR